MNIENNYIPQKRYSIAIVGSRDIVDYDMVKNTLIKLFNIQDIYKIVSGGARGVDSLAKRFAVQFSIRMEQFIADWDKYGKSAGFKRNMDIVDNSDCVIAFWDGKSKGTLNSVTTAINKGIPTLTINLSRKFKNTNIDNRYTFKSDFFLSTKKADN